MADIVFVGYDRKPLWHTLKKILARMPVLPSADASVFFELADGSIASGVQLRHVQDHDGNCVLESKA